MRNVHDDDRGRSGAFSLGSVYSKSPSNLRLFGYFSYSTVLWSLDLISQRHGNLSAHALCVCCGSITLFCKDNFCIYRIINGQKKKKSYCVLLACGFGLLFHLRLTNGFTDDLCNDCECRRSRYLENFFEIC